MAFNPNSPVPEGLFSSLKDSKALSPKVREGIFHQLVALASSENPSVFFGVGTCDNFLIDEIGIKKANREAMRRALEEIVRKLPGELEINAVVIDGNDGYQFQETVGREAVSVVRGDAKIPEISGASIIAKTFRDKLVDAYAPLYPHLGLETHKGYGVKKHADALCDPSKVT